jgi:exopolysaccharide biosynthesis polyprenyl glycosylphosphotransferase
VRAISAPDIDAAAVYEGMPEALNDRVVMRRDAFFRRTLAAMDILAAAIALVLSVEVIGAVNTHITAAALLTLPLVVLIAKAAGLYDRDEHKLRKTTIDEAPAAFFVAVVFTLSVWLGEQAFFAEKLVRGQVFGLVFSLFLLLLVGRAVARGFGLAVTPRERCVVLGNAGSAARVARKLGTARGVHAEVAGRIALDDGQYANGFPGCPETLGHVDQLPLLLVEHGIERVVIAPDGHDQERILGAIRLIKAMGVKVSVLPRLLEVVGSSATFDDVDGLALLGVRRYGLSASSAFLKRALDVTGALVGIVFMAPLLAAVAVAIKVDTRGPVFFRQRRIGRGGREFMMIKFRSMVAEAEDLKDDLRSRNESQGLFKIAEDPRVTSVGRFLRKTSLDELPQLFNVLHGDMSLVGPRPLVPDEDAMIEGWQRRRASLQPGMTGLWQIFGSARIPMDEMVKIDYLYGANWSLWLDLKILLRTLPYVATKRGM